MIYLPGDIIMYSYVPDKPFLGIVTGKSKSSDAVWVRWWSVKDGGWDEYVTPLDPNERFASLIGVLPYWAESDDVFGEALPLTERVGDGRTKT